MHQYVITGRISSVKNGKIYLIPIGSGETFYEKKIDTSAIQSGTFKFIHVGAGLIPRPYFLEIISDSAEGETGYVFIGPGNQEIIIDSINMYASLIVINSKEQAELRNQYNPFFRPIVDGFNSLNKRTIPQDTDTSEYANKIRLEYSFTRALLIKKAISICDAQSQLFSRFLETDRTIYK